MAYDLQGYTCHAFEGSDNQGEAFLFSRDSDGFVEGEVSEVPGMPGIYQVFSNDPEIGLFLGNYAGIKPALHALGKFRGWKAISDETVD